MKEKSEKFWSQLKYKSKNSSSKDSKFYKLNIWVLDQLCIELLEK